jgi:hypothetical protein
MKNTRGKNRENQTRETKNDLKRVQKAQRKPSKYFLCAVRFLCAEIGYLPTGPNGPGAGLPLPSGIPSPEFGAGPGWFALIDGPFCPKSVAIAATGDNSAKTRNITSNFFMMPSFLGFSFFVFNFYDEEEK